MSRTAAPAPWTIRAVEPGDAAAMADVFRRASLANEGDREALLAHPEVLEIEGGALAGSTVAAVDGTVTSRRGSAPGRGCTSTSTAPWRP